MNKTFLIAGAEDELGLELSKQLAACGHMVFATVRDPTKASELKRLCRKYRDSMCALALDPMDEESLEILSEELHYVRVDVLINNDGILMEDVNILNGAAPERIAGKLDLSDIRPMRLVEWLLPVLKASDNPLVINIGSILPKIARTNGGEKKTGRAISRDVLDVINRILARRLLSERVASVLIMPERVDPEQGNAPVHSTMEESVREMIEVISGLSIQDAGRFLDADGRDVL
jgi:NADP-dependent 3-hydroxy acid dehydrogenase YdfG